MATRHHTPAERIAAALNDDLEQVFLRHLPVANATMTPQEVTDMLTRVAVNAAKGATVTALVHKHEDHSQWEVCNAIQAAIGHMLWVARGEILATAERTRAVLGKAS
ncbi:hypothetical protein [Sphingomonas sp. Leaf257]|jgi:hypothetical protein|uniref:hypothetical protein n=1 Tax=Sphingomonas sp. Leaf257 TaxID=1736309 RepID=UPI0006FCF9C2|nr:hypothetical protein [Sphingomonas sp. Leaf257]KQO51381.1 hypothetical protein ASF14_07730 [Sphingomonas sp. Leaf257]